MMRRWMGVLAAAALVIPCAGRADDEAAALRALIARRAGAIVTVRVTMKTEMKGGGDSQSQEERLALPGVLVSPDGLVMLTNAPFSPKRLMQVMGVDGADEAAGIKISARAFKISRAGDPKEYDGFLAATDTVLDLAFVKMEGVAGALPAVDFADAAEVAVGDRVYLVARLSKGYDYAPYLQACRVSGEIAKPRKAWALDGSLQLGLPVFAPSGPVVGVITTLPVGSAEDASAEMGFLMAMRMLGGASGGSALFLVPAPAVKAVIDQAAIKAVEVAAERARKKPDAAPVKPAGSAPATRPATAKPRG